MKRKLIILLMVLACISGCSNKRNDPVKNEVKTEVKTPEVKDSIEKFYGTWRTSSVTVKGTRFDLEQLEAMGERKSVDIIMVINEDGSINVYLGADGSRGESVWTAGPNNASVLMNGLEFPYVDGELLFQGDETTAAFLEKVSDRQDKEIIDELTENLIEEAPEEEETEAQEEITEETVPDSIRPDIKEAVDAYEGFVDEYIAFMKKYEESDADMSLLLDYYEFMNKLTEYTDKMEALEKDMTDAETLYYLEVMTRCNEKMIKAIQ